LVLLATLNGQRFLSEQLQSIIRQNWPEIDLLVSDDGSTDGTLQLTEQFARKWAKGAFGVVSGPRTGHPADNYRSMILRASGDAEFVAFCDQDDFWLPDKLSVAIEALRRVQAGVPAVYCSPTTLIDEDGRLIGRSKYFRHEPQFRNALVQSIAGGNTMVLNWNAIQLLKQSCERTEFFMHDWWTYLIVTGAGGIIVYRPRVDTLYRQHLTNHFGSNQTSAARLRRLRSLLRGDWKAWNDANEASLLACLDLLSPESRRVFDLFRRARRGTPWGRTYRLTQARVFRQTLMGQLALYGATFVGRT
jgi:glycosyltransferase involved in cell wall biosynthesis